MIDETAVDIAVFEASALLAGLQVPIIAVLLEFYSRSKDETYMTGVKLSAATSIIFLGVSIASLVLLLQTIWTPFPAISYLILGLIVAAIFLIATVLMTAGLKMKMWFSAPTPKVEPMQEPKGSYHPDQTRLDRFLEL